MKFKIVLMWILVIVFGTFSYLTKDQTIESKCGIVLDKGRVLEKSKSSVWLDEALDIKYYDNTIENVKVTTQTYYQAEIGKEICFEQKSCASKFLLLLTIISAFIALYITLSKLS